MCESIDLNDQTIARIMAEKWIEYVTPLLFNSVCKHYFIDSRNLSESCSTESFAKVIAIRQHHVHLDEDIKIEILIEQDKLINKQWKIGYETDEEYFRCNSRLKRIKRRLVIFINRSPR